MSVCGPNSEKQRCLQTDVLLAFPPASKFANNDRKLVTLGKRQFLAQKAGCLWRVVSSRVPGGMGVAGEVGVE